MVAEAIFSTAYFPSIEYISALLKFSQVQIEHWENYQKQTFRNRCHILSANGILTLSVPILHEQKLKTPVKDLKISYGEPWQRIHWSALQSAYNKAPFFEFYKDDFEKIIFSNKVFLLDLNTELLELVLKILNVWVRTCYTSVYEKNYPQDDFRFLSDSKTTRNLPGPTLSVKQKTQNLSYPQVFFYKFGFIPNLSIIDLIFNIGKKSTDYL